MSSPDVDNLNVDIEMQQNLRKKLVSMDASRAEFLRDVQKIRTEDECLRDFKALLEDLNTEKLALVNELRHVNTDINSLEQAIRQAENSRKKSLENANKMYSTEIVPLSMQINEIRDIAGRDRLPVNVVDPCDLETILAGDQKTNGSTNVRYDPSTIFPLGVPYGQNPYGQIPVWRPNNMFNFFAAAMTNLHHSAASSTQSEEPAVVAGGARSSSGTVNERTPSVTTEENVTGQGGASSVTHVEPTIGFGPVSKQQQPPMKICASCQQEIHRNAPICPLCKSKSRSRHPKKKQRQAKV